MANNAAAPSDGPAGRRWGWWVGGGLLALGIVAAAVWWWRGGGDDRPETSLDFQAAVEMKNRAVARLENLDLEPSAESFEELAAKLPAEPLGSRNLVIARLMALDQAKQKELQEPEAFRRAAEAAWSALQAHEVREPREELPPFCAARFYALTGAEQEAIAKLREAIAATPPDAARFRAALWYELFTLADNLPEPAAPADAAEALQNAYEAWPENAALLVDLLRYRVRQDGDVAGLLRERRGELQRLAGSAPLSVQRQAEPLLEAIDAALAAGDEDALTGPVLGLTNVLNPLVPVYIDRTRVQPHLLEFVIEDFSEAFYAAAAEAGAIQPVPPIAVSFEPDDVATPSTEGLVAVEVADYDLDRRPDLVLLRDDRLEVFTQRRRGGAWELLTAYDLPGDAAMSGLLLADLDRDSAERPDAAAAHAADGDCLLADLDVVLYGPAGVLLLRNEFDAAAGTHSLTPIPQSETFEAVTDVLAVALAELDHDGDLDLVVSAADGLSLWANVGGIEASGGPHFRAMPPAANVPDGLRPRTLLPIDFDRSLTNDVILADTAGGEAGVLENLFHGRFRWRELDAGYQALGDARDLLPVDPDGNASWDLIGAGPDGLHLCSTRTVGPGEVILKDTRRISAAARSGALLWDYDNDGHLDLLAWGNHGLEVHRGQPRGVFRPAGAELFPAGLQGVRQCRAADLDGDGGQDVLIWHDGGLRWFLGRGASRNHWLDVTLVAEPNPQFQNDRNNFYGRGCVIEVKAGTNYQVRLVQEMTTRFGLGEHERADVVRVLWNNGIPQNEIGAAADRVICEKQITKGSCPFLYLWNGREYEFFTDCLWGAPIGLQFAAGVPGPCRHWEYLKLPGERLAEHDGEYWLMITEELWEACYLDCVKLCAVDHPADVEVYSNEKIASEQGAEHYLHTARHRRRPVAARDPEGRDLLPKLRDADGVYAQPFDARRTQGLAPPHYVELDLGELRDPERIVLFLHGWTQPTDTSLNIALSQDADIEAPAIPSIWVPDADGHWRQTIARAGFPGGKPKTIALDLSGAFLTDDYRLRIQTSMELYWDAAFFTVDEAQADHTRTALELTSAELRYRGFSRWVAREGARPETFETDRVTGGPRWPPMQGRFTRYGDVRELLAAEDDLQAVFGAGDALELRFAAPPPPPPGWRRDFLLYNVGWDKDADMNTVLGQTVEPLPFRAMSGYPYGPDEHFPDTPRHRRFLREYQTRTQNPYRFWKDLSRPGE